MSLPPVDDSEEAEASGSSSSVDLIEKLRLKALESLKKRTAEVDSDQSKLSRNQQNCSEIKPSNDYSWLKVDVAQEFLYENQAFYNPAHPFAETCEMLKNMVEFKHFVALLNIKPDLQVLLDLVWPLTLKVYLFGPESRLCKRC